MKKCVWIIFQATFILNILGMSVQAQPNLISEIPNRSTNFVQVGDLVYFVSGDSLFRTDATTEGTILLLTGGTTMSFTEFKRDCYFLSQHPDSGFELWKSDGTPSGTIRLKTVGVTQFLGHTEDFLYFTTWDATTGQELYRTNGTAESTILIEDINPGAGDGFHGRFAVVGDFIFFAADDGLHGTELWKSNGTADGTAMIKDIYPGASDGISDGPFVPPLYSFRPMVFSYNNLFYFEANTLEHGIEPWVSDGTEEGTVMLQDVIPGPSSPHEIEYKIANGETVYFMAYAPKPPDAILRGAGDLWKTSGTPSTTSRLATVGTADYDHTLFLNFQGKIYFFSDNRSRSNNDLSELWVTDGTGEGTELVIYIITPEGDILFFEEVNDIMLFYAMWENSISPFFRSDGTAAGTLYFMQFHSGWVPETFPRGFIKVHDLIFFADHEHGDEGYPENPDDYYQLMQTDGFTTQSVRQLTGISTVGTNDIVNFNGKVLFTTRDDQSESTDTQKRLWIYDPNRASQDSASLTLVNADNDEDIQTLSEGDTITKPADTFFNIRYNPAETPGSVVFKHQDKIVRIENSAPFSLRGDYSGNFLPWEAGVAGSHKVEAIPYSEPRGRGTRGTSLVINFTIVDESPEECLASGTILREFWSGVSGARIEHIPLDTKPTSTNELTIFEGPENIGMNYATRIRGYLCPPATGEYIFWIASNDHSELWLSTDDNPSHNARIAYVTGATEPRQWNKFRTQRSVPIWLEQGNRYYIEGLHKQGVGSDHIAVGWQLPDDTMERPIPGGRLSPFVDDVNTMDSMAGARYEQINIYPNPAQGSDQHLIVAGYEAIEERIETQVKIINMTGDVVFAETISCGGGCGTYLMKLQNQLVPGVYFVDLKTKDTRHVKRLLIK